MAQCSVRCVRDCPASRLPSGSSCQTRGPCAARRKSSCRKQAFQAMTRDWLKTSNPPCCSCIINRSLRADEAGRNRVLEPFERDCNHDAMAPEARVAQRIQAQNTARYAPRTAWRQVKMVASLFRRESAAAVSSNRGAIRADRPHESAGGVGRDIRLLCLWFGVR